MDPICKIAATTILVQQQIDSEGGSWPRAMQLCALELQRQNATEEATEAAAATKYAETMHVHEVTMPETAPHGIVYDLSWLERALMSQRVRGKTLVCPLTDLPVSGEITLNPEKRAEALRFVLKYERREGPKWDRVREVCAAYRSETSTLQGSGGPVATVD